MELLPGDFESSFLIFNFATWGMRTDHPDTVKTLVVHMNSPGTRQLRIRRAGERTSLFGIRSHLQVKDRCQRLVGRSRWASMRTESWSGSPSPVGPWPANRTPSGFGAKKLPLAFAR
jgi:hypothetical protein